MSIRNKYLFADQRAVFLLWHLLRLGRSEKKYSFENAKGSFFLLPYSLREKCSDDFLKNYEDHILKKFFLHKVGVINQLYQLVYEHVGFDEKNEEPVFEDVVSRQFKKKDVGKLLLQEANEPNDDPEMYQPWQNCNLYVQLDEKKAIQYLQEKIEKWEDGIYIKDKEFKLPSKQVEAILRFVKRRLDEYPPKNLFIKEDCGSDHYFLLAIFFLQRKGILRK